MIVPNTIGKSIRVVEFLEREIEIDHLIVAFDITAEELRPIIFGTLPAKNFCFYQNATGEDYDSGPNGRWVLPDGTRFSDIVSVRQFFKTTHRDVQDAQEQASYDEREILEPVPILDQIEARSARGVPAGRGVYARAVPPGCGS